MMKTKKTLRKGRSLLFIFFVISYFPLIAQNWKAEGIIKDSKGELLAGVNVILKNSSSGTVTDVK